MPAFGWAIKMNSYFWKMFCLAVIVSCFGLGCKAPVVEERPEYQEVSEEELLAWLAQSPVSFRTLKATLDMEVTSPEMKSPRRLDGFLALQSPDKIRLKGKAPLIPDPFDLASDGETFLLHIKIEDRDDWYKGSVGELESFEEFVLRPDRMAEAFLMAPLVPQGPGFYTPLMIYPEAYIVPVVYAAGGRMVVLKRITVERVNLTVSEQVFFYEDGRAALVVSYRDYAHIEGACVPKEVSLFWPEEEFSLLLSLSRLKVNGELPEGIFTPKVPESVEARPLK